MHGQCKFFLILSWAMQCNLFLFLCMGNTNSFSILHRQCKFYLFFALAMQILFIFCIGNANSFFFCIGNAIFFYFWLWKCNLFLFFAWSMHSLFNFCMGNANGFFAWAMQILFPAKRTPQLACGWLGKGASNASGECA